VRGALDLERLPAQREGRARALRGLAGGQHPIADPELPLEVLRTVHSFDPCIACAIHLTDTENGNAVSVRAK
jgi:Ni,Fe-hydrogenase I large subunit